MSVEVTRAREATPVLLDALHRLLPQLTGRPASLTAADLAALLSQPGLTLLLAVDAHGEIVGTVTLLVFETLLGRHGRIEDVVVDEAARGQGVGAALTQAAIQAAREQGAHHLELTSAPRREAANRLYQRLGFQRRETNVYELSVISFQSPVGDGHGSALSSQTDAPES